MYTLALKTPTREMKLEIALEKLYPDASQIDLIRLAKLVMEGLVSHHPLQDNTALLGLMKKLKLELKNLDQFDNKMKELVAFIRSLRNESGRCHTLTLGRR
jgi:hypothetical protein